MNVIKVNSNNLRKNDFEVTEEMREDAFEKDVVAFNSTRIEAHKNLIEKLKCSTEAISNRKFALKFFEKLLDRKQPFRFHSSWSSKRMTGQIGDAGKIPRRQWFKNVGKCIKDFPFDTMEEDHVHIITEVLFPNERSYDFVIWKGRVGYILEVQTNLGHLSENFEELKDLRHRDINKNQYVVLNTPFKLMEISSRQVFCDSNISIIDDILNSLDSNYAERNISFYRGMKMPKRTEPDCPFN